MKKLIILSAILLIGLLTFSKAPPNKFRYVVKFNSLCCGVPDAAPIFKFIASFKKKNKVKKISYYLVSPMGREGEYYMAFTLTELNTKQAIIFIKQIDATAVNMKDKGSATTEQNMVVDKESLSSRTTILKKTI